MTVPCPAMPTLPTRCMHGPRCQAMRAEHAFFECAAFPPNGLAAKRARHLAALAADAWNLPGLRDTARVIASELATNALRYGHLAVRVDVRVYIENHRLIFEVEDRNPQRPTPRPLTAARRTGRGFGLAIVADLADEWGYEYFTPDRKRVWAALNLPARGENMTGTAAHAMYPGDRRAWTLPGEPGTGPTLADVRAWCRGTITGPWGLPVEVAQDADHALTGMMPPRIDPSEPVTVRLIRVLAGSRCIVSVAVDEEVVRLEPAPAAGCVPTLTTI